MVIQVQLLTYILTLSLAAFLPGPGMTGLMFKTISQGYKNGLIMLCGLITGDIIFLLISIFFIHLFIKINSQLSFYLIIFACLYLFYLSYKYWNLNDNLLSSSNNLDITKPFFSYKDGLMITLSNPKTISFYLALIPTIFGAQILQQQYLILLGATVATLVFVGGLYIGFALKLRKMLTSLKLQQFLLRSLSGLMFLFALMMLGHEIMMRFIEH